MVTLGWQALGPVAADYAVVTMLKNSAGQVVAQNQRGLGGGGEGTAAWEAGLVPKDFVRDRKTRMASKAPKVNRGKKTVKVKR